MRLLGLDFDNTLVRYDKLFHQIAVEKNLIEKNFPIDKVLIRDYLRKNGKDEDFTYIQGEVYGLRIEEAEPSEGVIEALDKIHKRGIKMILISHKTKKPYKGPEYDLHQAALNWLEKNGFFKKEGLGWERDNIHFEATKENKICKIEKMQCDYYIDDLPEITNSIRGKTQAILYDPENLHRGYKSTRIRNWDELINHIV